MATQQVGSRIKLKWALWWLVVGKLAALYVHFKSHMHACIVWLVPPRSRTTVVQFYIRTKELIHPSQFMY
jgi:hypothetical protein